MSGTAQIITSILVPLTTSLLAVFITFYLNRKENQRRFYKEFFFDLIKHVDEYELALLKIVAQMPKRTQFEYATVSPRIDAEKQKQAKEEAIELYQKARLARSPVKADALILNMLRKKKGEDKEFVERLQDQLEAFAKLLDPFLHKPEDGIYPIVVPLIAPEVEEVAKNIHEAVSWIWAVKFVPWDIGYL